ncbi:MULTISPECIES: DUF1330 domain-containing protein [Pseudomonas]|uniref:DUF1330 domain-containing protein n=1 Tax=Pseudomonas cichorii TaxID=36746 RepID=A0A3M4VL34_PSECI|nr:MULTISPECIES: DUF1330 domain-containing protein [Pseudomonas]RMR51949.1 hypothetical protein ALP84_00701 [Pseudomonas cichorii]
MKKLACLTLAVTSLAMSAAFAQTPAPAKPLAYYVAEFEPTTPGAIKPYSDRVEDTFKPFGGRFIVRGGEVDALEGEKPMGRMVVIAFDNIEQARAWYRSPAYEVIKPIRHKAGKTNVYIVQGIQPPLPQ